MTRPQGVRALVWLKSREWLGESRDVIRLWVLGIGLVTWFAVVAGGVVVAANAGRLNPARDVFVIAAAAWPLWAVIPLLGGGGGEVVAGHRLAAYPVSARAVFGGAWLTALVDIPYLVVMPLVAGLAMAQAGLLAGGLAAAAFVGGASATGQLLAWVSFLVLAGRKRSGLAAMVLTACVVGGLGALPTLIPVAGEVGRPLPGGWLAAATAHAAAGSWAPYAVLVAALAAPVGLALLAGPALTAVALDREAKSGGAGARRWGTAGWSVRGSALRALVVANVRSIVRAIGAQVALAGVLAVPTITRLPGVEFAQVSLVAMGSVAAIAAATVLGVNAFAFDAGGAAVLLSWPLHARDVIVAKALAVAGCLLVGQVAVTLLGALVIGASASELANALLLCAGRSTALTALAMVWSVMLPAPSDYDSLRARISSPGAITTFVLAAAVATWLVTRSARLLEGTSGAVFAILLASGVSVLVHLVALDALRNGGTERVATAVQG